MKAFTMTFITDPEKVSETTLAAAMATWGFYVEVAQHLGLDPAGTVLTVRGVRLRVDGPGSNRPPQPEAVHTTIDRLRDVLKLLESSVVQ